MGSELKIILCVVGVGVLALLIGIRPRGIQPTLLAEPDANPDSMVIGDSGSPGVAFNGPAYLTRNVPLLFPPPLMHLNPVSSTETD